MLLTPPLEQFVAGIAAALFLCSVLWCTSIARKLLGALAVAGILNLLVADRNVPTAPGPRLVSPRAGAGIGRLPLFQLGAAIVTTLALLCHVPLPKTPRMILRADAVGPISVQQR